MYVVFVIELYWITKLLSVYTIKQCSVLNSMLLLYIAVQRQGMIMLRKYLFTKIGECVCIFAEIADSKHVSYPQRFTNRLLLRLIIP